MTKASTKSQAASMYNPLPFSDEDNEGSPVGDGSDDDSSRDGTDREDVEGGDEGSGSDNDVVVSP